MSLLAKEDASYLPKNPVVSQSEVSRPLMSTASKSIFSKRTSVPEPERVELPSQSQEEEELDIPAFIRKKMGK